MDKTENFFKNFIGVIARGQTYLNLIYVLLAFPLGLFYFIFLVTGLATGIGTIIVWIGILILALVIGAWWLFILFERQLASGMLHVKMNPVDTPNTTIAKTTWKKIGAYLSNPVTWKGLLYLFLKFPLGLAMFVIMVTFGSLTILFLTAPLTYNIFPMEISFTLSNYWRIDTLGEAMILFIAGIPLTFITLHISNGLAWINGWFAKVLLGNPAPESAPVLTTPAAVQPVDTSIENPQNEGPEGANLDK